MANVAGVCERSCARRLSSISLYIGPARAGRDSVYLVRDGAKVIGAVRLCNPYLRGKALAANMPFMTLADQVRLDREWQCYETASRSGLTPVPLWRDKDALMCEFLPGQRLSVLLAQEPADFWRLIRRTSMTLTALHDLGLTHMDASLANSIADNNGRGCRLIDFEYGPAHELTFEQQKAYDYLRLLESSMKFMPLSAREQADEWVSELDQHITNDMREADLKPLVPAISRLLDSAPLVNKLVDVFHGLGRL